MRAYTYNIQFSADYRNFVRITAIHEDELIATKGERIAVLDSDTRGPTRRRCLKGVASRYIVARERLVYSGLAQKRENPNWSLNLSFVTGLRSVAEK